MQGRSQVCKYKYVNKKLFQNYFDPRRDLQLSDEFLVVGHGGDEAAEEEDAEGAREEHGRRRVRPRRRPR